MTIPTKNLYFRQQIESELQQIANAHRFQNIEKMKEEENEQKKKRLQQQQEWSSVKHDHEEVTVKKESKFKTDHISKRPLNDLCKVVVDSQDANHLDLQYIYEDKLPSEAKELEKQDDDDEDAQKNKKKDVEQIKVDLYRMKKECEEMLPEEGRDHKKIMQLRFDQFYLENEKGKLKMQREQQGVKDFAMKHFFNN